MIELERFTKSIKALIRKNTLKTKYEIADQRKLLFQKLLKMITKIKMTSNISINEAREILQDNTITDEQIEVIINDLQLLTELIYEKWISEINKK